MWDELFRNNDLSYIPGLVLAKRTSFGIGGAVPAYLEPPDRLSFIRAVHLCRARQIRYRIMGRGTNVLAADRPKTEVVISTRKITSISESNGYIEAECGATLRELAQYVLHSGRVGVAGLADIPGTVGAAIRGNAGAFGDSVEQYVESVEVYDAAKLTVRRVSKAALSFGYRFSALLGMESLVVLSARFAFPKGDPVRERRRLSQCREIRQSTQPVQCRTCGSVFRRYNGISAGYYLERAGCKGLCRGGAEISRLHANFVINSNNATADDVLRLIDDSRERVYRQFGILLIPEVERIV